MTTLPGVSEKAWAFCVFLAASIVALWAAIIFGRSISDPAHVVFGGLAPNGLFVVGLGLVLTIGIFAGPITLRRSWTERRWLAAAVAAAAWLGTCAGCAAMVILANPLGLPLHGFESSVGNLYPFVCIICVLLTSLLPANVLQHRPGLVQPENIASQSEETDVALPRKGSAQERLWNVLKTLASRGPGSIHRRISVADDGTIVTSQGVLADVTGLSKTAVNRGLEALRLEGRIALQTTVHETRITILTSERPGTGQETPVGTQGNAIERRE